MHTPTWVDLEGTANTRDLGGLPVVGGGRTRYGVLLRSDNLQDLTAADEAELARLGVGTVLDLRTHAERSGTGPGPLATRLRHEHVPLIPDAAADEPGVVLPDRWQDGAVGAYLHYLTDIPGAVARAVGVVADPTAGGVVVHCAAGKDRTGVVCAVALAAVGVEPDGVVADFAATNDRIERIYRRLLGTSVYADDVLALGLDAHKVEASTMARILELLDERFGGVDAYLAEGGVDVQQLRERLVEQ